MIKYGIWCKYNDVGWTDGWATSGLLKSFKFVIDLYRDIDGRFATTDINFAYQYRNMLNDYQKIDWVLEVREKE